MLAGDRVSAVRARVLQAPSVGRACLGMTLEPMLYIRTSSFSIVAFYMNVNFSWSSKRARLTRGPQPMLKGGWMFR